MSAPVRVLLVSGDAELAEGVRSILGMEGGAHLLIATRESDAVGMARDARADLALLDHALPDCDALRLCRLLKAEPELSDLVVVLIVPPGSPDLELAGLIFGVDEYVARPPGVADLLTKVRGVQRIKQMKDELRVDRSELQRLHDEQRRSFDHLLELLVSLVEMRLPGSGARGQRIADMAHGLAERFEIPELMRRDLEIAARLQEMGRVIGMDDDPDAETATSNAENRKYVLATQALLRRVSGLQEAADIVGSIFENWDGTGFPEHRQQGQIPLRSRILRVLVDFMDALAVPGEPRIGDILERLDERRGTAYDPMVVVQLRELLAAGTPDGLRESFVRLPITALEEGMVLAEDLCTDSGLKLLARGTTLTASALGIIRRRHRAAPILEGAAVQRRAA